MRVFSPAISASFAQPGANHHSNDGNTVLQKVKKDKPKANRVKKPSARKHNRADKTTTRQYAGEAFGGSKDLSVDREIRSPQEGGKAAMTTDQRAETREHYTGDSVMTNPSQLSDRQECAADQSTLRTAKKRVQRGFADRHRKTAFSNNDQCHENHSCNFSYNPKFSSVLDSMSVNEAIAETESVEESTSEQANVPKYMSEDVSSDTSFDESMAADDASSCISYDNSMAESYHSIQSEASGYSITSIQSEVRHIQADVKRGFLLFLYELYPKHILGSKPSLLKYSRNRIPSIK